MPIVTVSGRQYLELSEDLANQLTALPEIAMGWKLVDVYLKGGRIERHIYVASGRYIALPIKFNEEDILKFCTATPPA